jgi:hypothetical protein
LIEALIYEAEPATPEEMQATIASTINAYVNQLVRQYKWQEIPELRQHSDELAKAIANKIINSPNWQKIVAAKGPAMIPLIQQAAANEISQLFNTMYQWEQTGQSEEGRQQAKQSSSDRPPDEPRAPGEKISATNVTRAELDSLGKLGDYLTRVKADKSILDKPEFEEYKDAIKRLAVGL